MDCRRSAAAKGYDVFLDAVANELAQLSYLYERFPGVDHSYLDQLHVLNAP